LTTSLVGVPPAVDRRRIGEKLARINELLEVRYRSASLGNLSDPLAETIYILLAKQAREAAYRPVFENLRRTYPRWIDLMRAPTRELERALRPVGFQKQRAEQLKTALKAIFEDNIRRRVGPARGGRDLTLRYLRAMPDSAVEEFLLRLPGIGPKSARCIMVYALARRRFAVDTHVHRVFTRLGLLKSRGRKNDHDPYEGIVPAKIRARLHVNLVHHGRAVCRNRKPKCEDCVLVSFCPEGQSQIKRSQRGKPLAAEIFSGAGGMGLGFRQAGYRIGVAVERDRHAAQTYRANHPGVPVIEEDVVKLKGSALRRYLTRAPDVLLAGPPCQGYSAAGSRQAADPRNQMFRSVTRIAADLRARVVVFENVPGLRRVGGTGFLQRVLGSLRARRYRAEPYLLKASDFGVPQNRRRYFIIASANRRMRIPGPKPTHRLAAERVRRDLAVTPSVTAALSGLPKLIAGVTAERLIRRNGSELLNASTMSHSRSVIAKIKGIEPGEGPISYRRLHKDVARTLVAGHRALPVHPTLDRTISVREAARLQGFPDSYVFCGPRGTQPLQVANAVPPPLAQAVAAHLLKLLRT
jgi:DNA (cytosine-5)-methyltransferase 1